MSRDFNFDWLNENAVENFFVKNAISSEFTLSLYITPVSNCTLKHSTGRQPFETEEPIVTIYKISQFLKEPLKIDFRFKINDIKPEIIFIRIIPNTLQKYL